MANLRLHAQHSVDIDLVSSTHVPSRVQIAHMCYICPAACSVVFVRDVPKTSSSVALVQHAWSLDGSAAPVSTESPP